VADGEPLLPTTSEPLEVHRSVADCRTMLGPMVDVEFTIPDLALTSHEPRDTVTDGEPLLPTTSEPLEVHRWTDQAYALVGRLFPSWPLAPAVSQPFQCPICCEDVSSKEWVKLSQCRGVEHGCCQVCMKRYIGSLVADGRVDSIHCPVQENCPSVLQPSEVLRLTDEATFAKYDCFRQMQGDPTLRQCHSCETLCRPARDEEGGAIPEMKCHNCGAEFCFYHSNAHAGQSCEAYRRQTDKDERNALCAEQKAKPCPGCGPPPTRTVDATI